MPDRSSRRDGNKRLRQCECGRFVQGFRIIDCRDLPMEVTQGQKWACDICWTTWVSPTERYQRQYQGRPFRELDWLELHGAPPSVINNQRARDAVKHAKLTQSLNQARDHRARLEKANENNPNWQGDGAADKEIERLETIIHRSVDVGRL